MNHERRIFLAMTVGFFALSVGGLPANADVAGTFKAHKKGSAKNVNHGAWDKLLKSYVRKTSSGLNIVNYRRFKKSGHGTLKTYLRMLQATNVKALDRGEQFAFWVNLYNAKTIDAVLDKYPVTSIKKIKSGIFSPGPWKLKNMKVNGVALTLDDVEHKILRGLWRDPRIHYAVNCASIGCPNLARDAFTGKNTEKLLTAGARNYINSPRGVRVSGGRVTASKIYKWFDEDFGGNERGVLKHLRRYAAPKLAAKLKSAGSISSYDYDWSLNDKRR